MRALWFVVLAGCGVAGADSTSTDPAAITAAIHDRFGASTGKTCTTVDCVRDAIAAKSAFVVHDKLRGIDSAVERGLVGTTEGNDYVTYKLSYDSDPCGGGCGYRGGTTLWRCPKALPPAADCKGSVSDCTPCKDATIVDSWHRGQPIAATSKGAIGKLFGKNPAELGPLFGTVAIGASKWDYDKLLDAQNAAALDGITVVNRGDSSDLREVDILMPNHCGAVVDRLTKAWGAPANGSWVDAANHRRTYVDLASCEVRFQHVMEISDWFGVKGAAPINLSFVDGDLETVAKQLGPAVTTHTANALSWVAPAIGTTGTTAEVTTNVLNSRVTAIFVEITTDPATVDALRAHLTKLLGKPRQDSLINDDKLKYTEWALAHMQVNLEVPVKGGVMRLEAYSKP